MGYPCSFFFHPLHCPCSNKGMSAPTFPVLRPLLSPMHVLGMSQLIQMGIYLAHVPKSCFGNLCSSLSSLRLLLSLPVILFQDQSSIPQGCPTAGLSPLKRCLRCSKLPEVWASSFQRSLLLCSTQLLNRPSDSLLSFGPYRNLRLLFP